MQKPSLEIGDQRNNGRDRRNPHQNEARRFQAQAEALVRQHGCRKHELGRRIDLAHSQRLDADRVVHQPRQKHRQQDQNVAADDRDDQPKGNLLAHAKSDVDADDEQLVGQRIEIGPKFRRPIEPLCQVAVDGIADAGAEKYEEGDPAVAVHQQPEDHGNGQHARQRDEVGYVDVQDRTGGLSKLRCCKRLDERQSRRKLSVELLVLPTPADGSRGLW